MSTKQESNVTLFITKKDVAKNDTLVINHGLRTMEAVKNVSDYIKELPLSTEQNDTLISLLKDQLLIAEHEAYIQGFTFCMDMIQSGGLGSLKDNVVKVADIEI